MRRARVAAGTALLFVVFLAVLFPTDAVVRHALDRAGWSALAFEHAALRPPAIRLDGVVVRDPTGALLVRAERVRLRPSLPALLGGDGGYPWTVEAALCGGTSRATIAADGPAATVALTVEEADLARCPPLAIAGGALGGRARGAARLRLEPGRPPAGDGLLDLGGASWQGGGWLASLGTLHAESASVRWRLGGGVLALAAIELAGPDIRVHGSGEVRLAEPIGASDLALRLAIAPAEDAPGALRLLLPPGTGPRDLVVAGTLASPSVVVE